MAKHTIAARLYRSRHGVWYWRLTIPLFLRSKAGRSEIRLSTNTESRAQALLCAQGLNLMADELFRELDATVSHEKSLSATLKLQQKLVKTRMQLEELQTAAQDQDFERRKEIAKLRPKLAPLLSEAAEAFIKAESERKAWRPKTLEAHRAVHRLLIECNGNIPTSQITRPMMIGFAEKLRKLPANYNKLPATRGKSIDAIIVVTKKRSLPIMSPVTSNRILERLKNLIEWCSLDPQYGVSANITERLTVRETDTRPVERFADDELKRLFQSPRITGDKVKSSYNFWLPVIAVYIHMKASSNAKLLSMVSPNQRHLGPVNSDEPLLGEWFSVL